MASGTRSKYEVIQQELTQQIRQGILQVGGKLPTEQELAAAYGVSRLTVRQAIGGLAAAGLVRSVQGKGSFVAEVKTAEAELRTIHFVTCSYHTSAENDAFHMPFLVRLGSEATQRGYTLCLSILPRHQSYRDFIRRSGMPPTFRSGVILSNVQYDADDLKELESERIPYVTMPWFNAVKRGPRVGSDGAAGMRMCLECLLRHGHREIGLVNCPVGYTDFQMNLEMYCRMLNEAGIAVRPENIVTASPFSEEEGMNAAAQLLRADSGLTAAVVFGDRAAAGFFRQLARCGIRVPEDMSVAVHDRYNWMDSAFPFRPSGTQQNIGGLAHAVFDALEKQRASGVAEDYDDLVAPDWIDGGTVAFTVLGVSNLTRQGAI
ncbi:MAG: GntR family transcriptional regulator [Lentisphaeria bacterium]|nr:GntR family transcriptional regulator [Lentisphaeria bacterium]